MIVNLPHRAPEIGRLTFGEKGKKGEPVRLDTWRARSADEHVLLALASIYGGDVKPCAVGGHEVVLETDTLDVLLPPDPLTAWYERWAKSGCQRRCDGERCMTPVQTPDGGHLQEVACLCASENIIPGDSKEACSVNVRLKVVLPDVPGLGIWLVISGSINAAMELPAQVSLLERMAARGALIPAELAIEKREAKKPWERYVRKFGVPVLRVRKSMRQLAELADGWDAPPPTPAVAPVLSAPVVPALESGEERSRSQAPAAKSAPPKVESAPGNAGGGREAGPLTGNAAPPPLPGEAGYEASPIRAAQQHIAEMKAEPRESGGSAATGPAVLSWGPKRGVAVTDVPTKTLETYVQTDGVPDADRDAALAELDRREGSGK